MKVKLTQKGKKIYHIDPELLGIYACDNISCKTRAESGECGKFSNDWDDKCQSFINGKYHICDQETCAYRDKKSRRCFNYKDVTTCELRKAIKNRSFQQELCDTFLGLDHTKEKINQALKKGILK